jgi:hypothetical protein
MGWMNRRADATRGFGRGLVIRVKTCSARGPDTRTTATADLPGAVEIAKIVDRSGADIWTFGRWLDEAKRADDGIAGNKS